MKNKRPWICFICLLLALSMAACSCSARTPATPSPSPTPEPTPEASPAEEALRAYVAAINARDYEKLYGLIDQSGGVSKEDFIARNRNIYEGMGAKDVRFEALEAYVDERGDVLRFEMSLDTSAGPIRFVNQAVFTQYEGAYRLKWNSNMIFPNLNDTDKVRVSTLKGERGRILDRNGVQLVGKDNVYSAGFVPGKIDADTRAADIAAVAELLGMTSESIEAKLSEGWVKDDLFVPLKSISYTDTDKKERLLKIKGIALHTVQERVYALGEKAAHLTGYIHNISQQELEALEGKGYGADSKIGKAGVESLFEERMRGADGCRITIVDESGAEKQALAEIPARHGEDIELTIDAAMQERLYDKMKADKGAAIVMDPETGEVLALVSTPSYDPNEFILGLTQEKWAQYNDEKTQPMFNRFKAAYAPGSSIKPVIAALGISGNAFLAQEDFGASGLSWQKDAGWGNYRVTTLKAYSGPANVQNALVYSDNIYFAKAALKIGGGALAQGLKNIGFGEDVPFEFGLSQSAFGENLAFNDEIDLANSGFGQGKVLINPVHMAAIYSALANGGDMVAPRLEKTAGSGAWKQGVFSGGAVQAVRDAMIQVVENPNGTAHAAKVDGLIIAGKTGTAQIKASRGDAGTELGWFAAFSADESADKRYLAVAVIEDVQNRGGSQYVLPIVRSVFAQ